MQCIVTQEETLRPTSCKTSPIDPSAISYKKVRLPPIVILNIEKKGVTYNINFQRSDVDTIKYFTVSLSEIWIILHGYHRLLERIHINRVWSDVANPAMSARR
jgi:hypothetical protein